MMASETRMKHASQSDVCQGGSASIDHDSRRQTETLSKEWNRFDIISDAAAAGQASREF